MQTYSVTGTSTDPYYENNSSRTAIATYSDNIESTDNDFFHIFYYYKNKTNNKYIDKDFYDKIVLNEKNKKRSQKIITEGLHTKFNPIAKEIKYKKISKYKVLRCNRKGIGLRLKRNK